MESLDVARMLGEYLRAASVSFLITDFTGGSVLRLGSTGSVETGEPAQRISLRGTLYDDVIRSRRPRMEETGTGTLVRVVAPVTTLGDAVGLLELFLPAAPNAQVMREIGETAHALAYIVIANRSFTDAMGHDVDAALLAALRRARRAGTGLGEQARQADQAMRDHGRQGHVTRQLLRINLLDGTTEFVNAEHPWPLRTRDGQVRKIAPKVDLPSASASRPSTPTPVGCGR